LNISKQLLVTAGILSFAVALFQIVIIFSPNWSLYFGAPETLVSNTPLLYVTGITAAVFFAVFGLYAISGAGYIRPLPFLRAGLLIIGFIYVLRGLVMIPMLLIMSNYLQTSKPIPETGLASSLVSLFIGLVYLIGTIGSLKRMKPNNGKRMVT
jgi:hypothetical protein